MQSSDGLGDTTVTINSGGTVNGSVDMGAGIDTLIVDGTLNLGAMAGDMGAGDDVVAVSGAWSGVGLNLGAGNDTFTLDSTGALAAVIPVDAGDDVDTLIYTGTVSLANVNPEVFINFEHLVKNGPNTWSLVNAGATLAYDTLSVNQGALALVGSWSFTDEPAFP